MSLGHSCSLRSEPIVLHTHLQQFWISDLFVLLSATLKWKWLVFACYMSSYCLFATQSGIILFRFVFSSCPLSWFKEDYVNSRVTVITFDLFRASRSFPSFFFCASHSFLPKSYFAQIRTLRSSCLVSVGLNLPNRSHTLLHDPYKLFSRQPNTFH